jgi:3-oxoacyl-[acyl-carrier-protein] synthase II
MRIWVTGIGIVSPLGRSATVTMDRLLAGERAFGPLTLFHIPDARVDIAAEIPGLTPFGVAPPGEEAGWSRTDTMAVLAAREALAQAGLSTEERPIDLVTGGTTAGMFETEELLAQLARDPATLAPFEHLLSHPLSATGDRLASAVGPFRRVRTLCSACSSGANAVVLAAAWLRSGAAGCVLAGAADGLCRLTFSGFGALSALSPEPCRPFDRRRRGLNLGEGAAYLVLETEEHARARGAAPLVELYGYAVGAEAHHITNPEPHGGTAARVMRAALTRAGIAPADLGYVNAHGTATPLNDAMEAAALRACLGDAVSDVFVSSTKGQIGHTLGAAGAIEAAVTALVIQRQELPPTAGLEEVDPACVLRHVFTRRSARVRAAMSSSFGFGGADTVLVLGEPGAFPEPFRAERRRVVLTGGATVGPLGVCASAASVGYLGDAPPVEAGRPIPFEAGQHLDLPRARRLDRSGRLVTSAIQAALADAGATVTEQNAPRLGAIVGSSFGSVDASTAFMGRVYEKGAKFASPADFPNLVPSSPVGHASIYLGLRGIVFAMSDLGASAEAAITTAAELVAAGEADLVAAGSVEEASAVVERIFGPLCSQITDRGVRGEGACIAIVEPELAARARGAHILAQVAAATSFRGVGGGGELRSLPPPTPRSLVVSGREEDRLSVLLAGSPWAEVPRVTTAPRCGDHEGAGGFALVAALGALAAGTYERVLCVGLAPDRVYAFVLDADRASGDSP